ncbi:MAG: hypothetical protein ACOVLC_03080 [Flavobacterium sp.]
MDNIITYTKDIPFIKRFFGIAFLLLGVFMLFLTGSFFTIILMVIGFAYSHEAFRSDAEFALIPYFF